MARYLDIARLWAEQAPKGPRKAGTYWRDGRDAGHWGTPVARLVDSPKGLVALIAFPRGGTNTAMMVNECEAQARKAGFPTFRVRTLNVAKHADNIAYFEAEAKACEERVARARSRDWQAEADKFRATAKLYQEAFGL